jgi:hypothetical protein
MLIMGTGSYPATVNHSRNAARSPGMGHATPILTEYEDAIAAMKCNAIATGIPVIFWRNVRPGPETDYVSERAGDKFWLLQPA